MKRSSDPFSWSTVGAVASSMIFSILLATTNVHTLLAIRSYSPPVSVDKASDTSFSQPWGVRLGESKDQPKDWGIGLGDIDGFRANLGHEEEYHHEGIGPDEYVCHRRQPVWEDQGENNPNEFHQVDEERYPPHIHSHEGCRHAAVSCAQDDCEAHDFDFVRSSGCCNVCWWRRACSSQDARVSSLNGNRRQATTRRSEEVADEIGELFSGLMERVQAGHEAAHFLGESLEPVVADMD